MILTEESRAKGAATRAAALAVKDAEREAREVRRLEEIARVEAAFPVKCSVVIDCPGDKARHGKTGKVVEHNTNTANVEIGVRISVENPKKAAKPTRAGGVLVWYLPSELKRLHPPRS